MPAAADDRTDSQKVFLAPTIPVGTHIWHEDEKNGTWECVQVLSQDNTILTVEPDEGGGEVFTIDLGFHEIYPANPRVCADMTSLYHIHEAGILHNLEERMKPEDTHPYTFMGTVLVAVNPLRRIPGPEMDSFRGASLNPEAPHPYALAENAFQQMSMGTSAEPAHQSIVISGESGAGKTETAKIVLGYLTARGEGEAGGLDRRMIESSPILEAFGNAKTTRNPNSSRFGKFMKLQFSQDESRKLSGGFIETYLLEKSRVVFQSSSERNFHVFFQLLAGLSGEHAASCELDGRAPADFAFLAHGTTVIDGVDDGANFQRLSDSLTTLGVSEENKKNLWNALAAVLYLGNVRLVETDSPEGPVAGVENADVLDAVGRLTGIPVETLTDVLTVRHVETRGEEYSIHLTVEDACFARDAIAKALYEALFAWVVTVVNGALGKGPDTLPSIGVLDIFGFEAFDKNEFEQLLINFANESLQDTFNQQVISAEIRLYKEENIECAITSIPDNSGCVDLISAKPDGIFPTLDAISRQPRPSDEKFCSEVHKKHAKEFYFPKTHPKDKRDKFWVKHFAGKVQYTVENWIVKNNDAVPDRTKAAVAVSTSEIIKDGFAYEASMHAAAAQATGSRRRRTGFNKPSVASTFLGSMKALKDVLGASTCSFIRCIKPNAAMVPDEFDKAYVVEQLRALGLLQTCEVLKVGLPTRISYSELMAATTDLPPDALAIFENEPEEVMISALLWAFEVSPEAYRLGRTRVFFRSGQISTVQGILQTDMSTKHEWLAGRLQEAMAARTAGTAAAEESVAAKDAAIAKLAEAKAAMENVLKDGAHEPSFSLITLAEKQDCELVAETAAGHAREDYEKLGEGPAKSEAAVAMEMAKAELLFKSVEDNMLKCADSVAESRAAQERAEELGESETAEEAWAVVCGMDATLKELAAASERAVDGAARCQSAYAIENATKAKELSQEIISGCGNALNVASDLHAAEADVKASWEASLAKASAAMESAEAVKDASEQLHVLVDEIMTKLHDLEVERLAEAERLAAEEAKRKAEEERARQQQEKERQLREAEQAAREQREAAARAAEQARIEEARRKAAEAAATSPASGIVAMKEGSNTEVQCAGRRLSVLDTPSVQSASFFSAKDKAAEQELPPGWDAVEGGFKNRITGDVVTERPTAPAKGTAMPQKDTSAAEASEAQTEAAAEVPEAQTEAVAEASEAQTEAAAEEALAEAAAEGAATEMAVEQAPADEAGKKAAAEGGPEEGAAATAKALPLPPPKTPRKVAAADDAATGATAETAAGAGANAGNEEDASAQLMQRKMQGFLLKQSKYLGRWRSRYFVLDHGCLDYYQKRADVGTKKYKRMELQVGTITGYTDEENRFTVETEGEEWVLTAKNDEEMQDWISAINAHVYALYLEFTQQHFDEWWEKGTKIHQFHRMDPNSQPLAIRKAPSYSSERTGEGIFPGEVLEMVQTVEEEGSIFFRLADERGWAPKDHPRTGASLFTFVPGKIREELHSLKYKASMTTPLGIRYGPAMDSIKTGEGIWPGEEHLFSMTFQPDDEEQTYVRMADGRGWVFLVHPGRTDEHLFEKVW